MAIGSGLGAQFGIATETTRNTYVAPTLFYPGTFNVKKRFNREKLGGSAAGRHGSPGEFVTNSWAEGKYEGQVLNASFGRLFMHMFGTTVTPVQQAATTAYLQSHIWADNFGKYFTAQEGRPNRAGTPTPVTATGCKMKSLEFSCTVSGLVKVVAEFEGSVYTEAQTIAAAAYTLSRSPFNGNQMDVKLGTFGSTASVTGVKGYSIKFERPMQESTDATYAGAAGAPAEHLYNSEAMVTGTLDLDFATKADFMDRATANTATSLTIEHIGPIIASSYNETLRFRLPKITFGDDPFEVTGPGVVSGSLSFEAFQDASGLAFLDYMSTDESV